MALPDVSDGIEIFKEYSIEPMQWEVPAFPDGPPLKMNGTIQEVIAQLREINPHLDESIAAGHDTLHKRTDFTGATFHCHTYHNSGWKSKVEDGITYLRKVGGVPSRTPGPGKFQNHIRSRDDSLRILQPVVQESVAATMQLSSGAMM